MEKNLFSLSISGASQLEISLSDLVKLPIFCEAQ